MADQVLCFRFVDVEVVISSPSATMSLHSILKEQLIENKVLQAIVSK